MPILCSARGPECVNKRLCIVLVHQYTKMGGSSALMRGMAKSISRHGFSVVTFDMRGAGKSLGRATWTGSAEVKDVVAVSKWVIRCLQQEVLLVGSSAGANSGLLRLNEWMFSMHSNCRCSQAAVSTINHI